LAGDGFSPDPGSDGALQSRWPDSGSFVAFDLAVICAGAVAVAVAVACS